MLVNSSDLLKTHCIVCGYTQCVSLAYVTILTFPHTSKSFKTLTFTIPFGKENELFLGLWINQMFFKSVKTDEVKLLWL